MLSQALELGLKKLQKTAFMGVLKSFMVGFTSPDFLLSKSDLGRLAFHSHICCPFHLLPKVSI